MMQKSKNVFRYGELFSGPGGLSLGAKKSTIETAESRYSIEHQWASDLDENSCKTYRANICPEHPESVICSNAAILDIKSLPQIDAFAFGFPCNDFSIVGEQKGVHGTFGGLYKYGVDVLRYHQPKFFVAENVGGLRSSNEGKAFHKILKALSRVGYNLYPHFYKFEEYGVPQTRHRVLIVGIRADINIVFRIPKPTTSIYRTAQSALTEPPIPRNAPNNELTAQSDRVIERLKYIKPGQNAFNAKMPKRLQLNVKGAKLSQIYKRLDPNKPAYTITGSGGGGTHVYHWSENRALTNRERARIQTFPDAFEFIGSKEGVRKQIGMAVPPLAAEQIFTAILKTFAGVEYEYIQPNLLPTFKVNDLSLLSDDLKK